MLRLSCLISIAIAGAAAAQQPAPAPTPAPKPKLKCEMVEDTGSRLLKHRECYDPSIRRRADDQLRRDIDHVQQNVPGRPGG